MDISSSHDDANIKHDAVFVTTESSLVAPRPGGVQLCTSEYFESLELAGLNVHTVTFQPDNRLRTKMARKLRRRPYQNIIPPELPAKIGETVNRTAARFVFLNQCDLLEQAEQIKRSCGDSEVVFLSHGLKSVDYLHALRARGDAGPFSTLQRDEVSWLGLQLIEECKQRAYVDKAVCLSAVEVEIERWLGSTNVTWVPRTVKERFLNWRPQPKRAGFVGTLNHPPNVEGLMRILRCMEEQDCDVQVRVVGGPPDVAKRLLDPIKFVEYLGPLDDDLLRKEAETWCCFLHPLFCYAMGASTKLAIGLSWGIPIVTTESGMRGYEMRDAKLPTAGDPNLFVEEMRHLCGSESYAQEMMQTVRLIAQQSPQLEDVASKLRNFLLNDK